MTACIVSGNVARPDSAMSLRRLRACGLIRAAPTLVCSSILGTGRWTAPACPETRWCETSAGWREAGVSVVGGLQCGGGWHESGRDGDEPVTALNRLRNRAAHHEHLLGEEVTARHRQLLAF